MKIVLISNTHGPHDKILLPEDDMIFHAGDVSNKETYGEVTSFLHWFKSQSFKHKVFIAGNHDFIFEENPPWIVRIFLKVLPTCKIPALRLKVSRFLVHPPEFYNRAFMKKRGEEMRQNW
jgi:predicted phosphodiesterase